MLKERISYVRRREKVLRNSGFEKGLRKRRDAPGGASRHEFFSGKGGVLRAARTVRLRKVYTAQYHRRHRQRRFRIYQHKWRQAEGYEREKAYTVPQKAPGICISDVQPDCQSECKGKYRGGRLSV